jgi:uncharacterized protein YneF (UPF0154 family)
MRQLKHYIRIIAFAVLCVFGHSGTAHAATPAPSQPPSGVALTPAIQDRVLGPAEKTISFSVELANQTDAPITFSVSSNDFTALNQTGGLAFLGSDINRVSKGNGLSGILKIDTAVVTLGPKSTRKITARIDDVSKLAPGGHYAAILAQALPTGTPGKGNRVTINQVVSSLVFLETAGQGTKTLELLPPKIGGISFSLPQDINLVFKATGNTQTIPRGVVTIDRGGAEIGRGIINENSSLLLPGSTRLLQTSVSGDKHPWLPGRYTMRVQYRYEGSLGISTYEKTFLYINIQAVLLLVLAVILAIYGIFKSRKFVTKFIKKLHPPVKKGQRKLIIISDKSHKEEMITVVKKPSKTKK